jgi:hypothetical protein
MISHEKRETGPQKKKFPKKSSRLSEYLNLIPALGLGTGVLQVTSSYTLGIPFLIFLT